MLNLSPICSKFHLGCGPVLVRGYLNVDVVPDITPGTVLDTDGAGTFLCSWDLRNGIPAADGSLQVVYHCHMLEHLTNAEGRGFLAECFRALMPGGVLRVVVPDLALWIENYTKGEDAFFDNYRSAILRDDRALYPTNSAVFMGMLHNHGHQMGYDYALLARRLEDLGFEEITRTRYGQSMLPEMASIETMPLRALESLCVECLKPIE